jgi:predicted lipid-binding transport protein (Tim44 family)
MANTQLLELVLIATIAGIILFRLYTVLGRRTGHERPPQELRIPGHEVGETLVAGEKTGMNSKAPERPSDPVASGLFDISLADRNFDKDHFLIGARSAYEMIETAFHRGDKVALRPLLNDDVNAAFAAAIDARNARGETVNFNFVGYRDVKIAAAALKGRQGEITLSFAAQFISVTHDAQGRLIEGDEHVVRDVTDIWTFARDVTARDPNWTLIACAGEDS